VPGAHRRRVLIAPMIWANSLWKLQTPEVLLKRPNPHGCNPFGARGVGCGRRPIRLNCANVSAGAASRRRPLRVQAFQYQGICQFHIPMLTLWVV
jgi:hypothetical protein